MRDPRRCQTGVHAPDRYSVDQTQSVGGLEVVAASNDVAEESLLPVENTMKRTATCQCGGFRVMVTGDPDFVNICHCTECRRRSGAPLTSNAYFSSENVHPEGNYKIYSRPASNGRSFHNHFCPNCGTTVRWTLDIRPNNYGVAIGTFNDPNFPSPTASVWESSKYFWVTLPEEIEHFSRGLPSEN